MHEWLLADDAADTVVSGRVFDGVLTGGNTEDVQAAVNGIPAFHLDGSTQYVTIPLVTPLMRADEILNLWTKHAGNPVLSDETEGIQFPTLVSKPGGGWYAYGVYNSQAVRWESTDLITWANRTLVMAGGGVGAWDEELNATLVFRKPDNSWVMLYRGAAAGGSNIQPGFATSADGATWTRKDNSGVNDGLWDLPTGDYDPFCVILVGTRYYIYTNGDPTHGHLNILYTDDDFATVQQYGTEPIFNNGFCPFVWKQDGNYYMLISRDLNDFGSALYDHGLALYRSPVPTFDYNNREYLGYAIINDEAYDARYLDLPTMPFTDIRRDTYTSDFGSTFHVTYTGGLNGVFCLASTTQAAISALTAIPESASEVYAREGRTFSFWMQADTLVPGDVYFSIGRKVDDSYPVMHAQVATGSTNIALYLAGGVRTATPNLQTNTPYHIVIVDDVGSVRVYVNGVLTATLAYDHLASYANNLYIGKGDGGDFDGYQNTWRIYNHAMSTDQVLRLYRRGYP